MINTPTRPTERAKRYVNGSAPKVERTGRFAMIEQFLADGITHMFGNPGTVEQGFLDSVENYFPEFEYILTQQEAVAVGIADGYARATKKPTVVQLHSGVGLGNGIGMMYQAMRGHAPLVVLAGESGTQYDAMDAQMAADLVSMARPVTKWATRVIDPDSLLRVLRRAIKMAGTAPYGPVFVALPMDVLDAINDEPVVPTSFPSTRVLANPALIENAADLLAGAENPMILMGDGIAFSEAQGELTRLAELWGAQVWGVDASEVNISWDHPLYMGSVGHMFGEHSSGITRQADRILICGTYVFPDVFPKLQDVFAKNAHVVHFDLNAYEIAKNFPVDLGVVCDPKLSLAQLADALENRLSTREKEAAQARIAARVAHKQADSAEHEAIEKLHENDVPMKPGRFMRELAKRVSDDVFIFDEALTTSPELTRHLTPTLPDHFFQTRGGSLGVGIPGAVGIKVANPEKEVWGFTGDGGAMYTYQALWTAAHHDIAAKFVVCNNQSYMLLKLNIMQYWKERGIEEHTFPKSFDLTNPVVDFAGLAQSLGVASARVSTPDEIVPAIEQAIAHDGPFLIDLVITNEVPGSHQPIQCGQ